MNRDQRNEGGDVLLAQSRSGVLPSVNSSVPPSATKSAGSHARSLAFPFTFSAYT